VKPENARAVEEHVIRLARGGKLQDRVDEDILKKMLEVLVCNINIHIYVAHFFLWTPRVLPHLPVDLVL